MKKIFIVMTCFCLILNLAACGSKTSGKDESPVGTKENKGTELELSKENTVEDYAEFTLFKITTSKKITASVAGDLYYENQNSGETYVDMIFDWTNISTETITSDKLAVVSAVNDKGTAYTNCLYAVETNNATYVSQYENIAPLSKVRLHCAVSVPESETDLTLKLIVKGNVYTYNYSMGREENNAKEIKIGDTIDEADYAALTFNGIEYTDDVLPSNTSGSYSHYPIESTTNTYLVIKFDITNHMSGAKRCDTFVGVKAVYMDKYTYTGSAMVEDDDGAGFNSYEDIAPLSTRHFYYLIEVPKSIAGNEVALTFSFNGQEYTFTGK